MIEVGLRLKIVLLVILAKPTVENNEGDIIGIRKTLQEFIVLPKIEITVLSRAIEFYAGIKFSGSFALSDRLPYGFSANGWSRSILKFMSASTARVVLHAFYKRLLETPNNGTVETGPHGRMSCAYGCSFYEFRHEDQRHIGR